MADYRNIPRSKSDIDALLTKYSSLVPSYTRADLDDMVADIDSMLAKLGARLQAEVKPERPRKERGKKSPSSSIPPPDDTVHRGHSLRSVAPRLDTSVRTLLRRIRRRQIHAVKFGGEWRISETELRRLVREGVGPQR